MAAPGGGGEVRLRLTFEYPPPALPQSRHLWFMLETERCRAVTDVSAIIRERFYYSRRGALSLYLDGSLLPPGESARLIRDNDSISVKWEELGPDDESDDPRKRRRSVHSSVPERVENESDDRRKRVPERVEDESDDRKRKKRRSVQSSVPESAEDESDDCKKRMGIRERVEDGSDDRKRKKRRSVQSGVPESAEDESDDRKKRRGIPARAEDGSDNCRKRRGVLSGVPEKAMKRAEVTVERARKKTLVTPEEGVSERLKKAGGPREELSEEAPEKKPPHQGEPGSPVHKKAPPPLRSSWTKATSSSSSSSDLEDTGRGRGEEPGPPLRSPLISSLASSPSVCNGRVARGGTQHRPPLKTAGRGVARGRGIDNLPWRGRGFRGRGEAHLQNHFFYNYSPEKAREQQLNEDLSNVSVLIQNPPEIPKTDYSALPLLAAPPPPGKIIAFKLLELTENYTPEVSDYKEGRVLSYDPVSQQLEVEILSQQKRKEPGKFDLVYEGEDGIDIVEYAVPQECKITQAWCSLIEPRLVIEHEPLVVVAVGP